MVVNQGSNNRCFERAATTVVDPLRESVSAKHSALFLVDTHAIFMCMLIGIAMHTAPAGVYVWMAVVKLDAPLTILSSHCPQPVNLNVAHDHR
jgi:hypothetical protein